MGKILVRSLVRCQIDCNGGHAQKSDGTSGIKVGEPIALLAEEGDDISNLEAPKLEASEAEASKPEPSKSESSSKEAAPPAQPKASTSHSHSNQSELPSVQRLLAVHGLDASKVKGTGFKGRLTKGDILAAAKQISSSSGSFTSAKEASIAQTPKFSTDFTGGKSKAGKKPVQQVEIKDEKEYRRMFLEGLGMLEKKQAARKSAVDVIKSIKQQKPFSGALNAAVQALI
jgi:pyruvate/2-oxoglutarate dehydrogenase complex dihydrolipoamide acyltransferase (E2) component